MQNGDGELSKAEFTLVFKNLAVELKESDQWVNDNVEVSLSDILLEVISKVCFIIAGTYETLV